MPTTYKQLKVVNVDELITRAYCIDETKSKDHTFWRCLAVAKVRHDKRNRQQLRVMKSTHHQLEAARQLAEECNVDFDKTLTTEDLDHIADVLGLNIHIYVNKVERRKFVFSTLYTYTNKHCVLMLENGIFHYVNNPTALGKKLLNTDREVRICSKCWWFVGPDHTGRACTWVSSTRQQSDDDRYPLLEEGQQPYTKEWIGTVRLLGHSQDLQRRKEVDAQQQKQFHQQFLDHQWVQFKWIQSAPDIITFNSDTRQDNFKDLVERQMCVAQHNGCMYMKIGTSRSWHEPKQTTITEYFKPYENVDTISIDFVNKL